MEDLQWIAACPLFRDIPAAELRPLLAALAPTVRAYARGGVLVLAGYENHAVGMVLSGLLEAAKTAPDGTRLTVTHIGQGGIFGDVLSGSGTQKSPVTVTAATASRVLWLPFDRLIDAPDAPRQAHRRLLRNFIALTADKYFALERRVGLLTLPRLRDKLLQYLRTEASPAADGWVETPFTREALAAYLGCDRTALCRELSRLRDEGALKTEGRRFLLREEREAALPKT